MKKPKFIDYKKYLASRDWLLKKNELISIYLEQGWSIECDCCGETDNLQVHHVDYKEIGRENLSEKNSKKGRGIWQLKFICRDCHRCWHFEDGFREKVQKAKDEWFDMFLMSEEFEKTYGA